MAYTKVGWKDYPDTTTPLTAANMKKMDDQIATLTEAFDGIMDTILDKLYPIGSVYLETTGTNPGTKFGGTWTSYGASDTYLRLGGNSSGGSNSVAITEAHIPTLTTGYETSSHSHTVTISPVEGHTHDSTWSTCNENNGTQQGSGMYPGVVAVNGNRRTGSGGGHGHTATVGTESVSHRHKFTNDNKQNLPITPKYVQVYAWKRIQ